METFNPEDILIDSLNFKLHKGSYYVHCQGFKNKTAVGFKPLRGLFSQVRYLPLTYMGHLTIELELITNATNCINYRSQNFKRYRENSSRLEFSGNSRGTRSLKLEQARIFQKNLHSVIYEALGSHSHGFSIFLKIRAGSNFAKILEAPGLENSSRLEFSKKNP